MALFATFVVPTYNRAGYIAECLRSIQEQSDGDWAVVIVDDASTDGTEGVVSALGLPGLTYLRNERQAGASVSRNRAMERAAPGLIVLIDSDDRLHASHLARVRAVLRERPQAAIVCCDSRIIDHEGRVLHEGRTFQEMEAARKGYPIASGPRTVADIFVFSTSFPGTTLRTDVVKRHGGLDQSIFPLDDVDLQLRVAAAGDEVYYLHESLASYRTHPGSESAGTGRAVWTCTKKVECLQRWRHAAARIAPPGVVRRRMAAARLELALAAAKAGQWGLFAREGARSALLSPSVPLDFLRRRRARKTARGG